MLIFKQPLWKGMSIILFFALVLSACDPANSPTASRGASTPAGNQELASQSITPTPAKNPADTQLEYTNQDFGSRGCGFDSCRGRVEKVEK